MWIQGPEKGESPPLRIAGDVEALAVLLSGFTDNGGQYLIPPEMSRLTSDEYKGKLGAQTPAKRSPGSATETYPVVLPESSDDGRAEGAGRVH